MNVADPGAQSDDFGVYVHWPFCASKCPYCDFNSHVRHRPVDQGDFVAALREQGLLVVGAAENVIRLIPPLIIDQSHVAEALEILDRVSAASPKAA